MKWLVELQQKTQLEHPKPVSQARLEHCYAALRNAHGDDAQRILTELVSLLPRTIMSLESLTNLACETQALSVGRNVIIAGSAQQAYTYRIKQKLSCNWVYVNRVSQLLGVRIGEIVVLHGADEQLVNEAMERKRKNENVDARSNTPTQRESGKD